MQSDLYASIIKQKKAKKKQFALLIDPDKFDSTDEIIKLAHKAKVDFFMVGGSIITSGNFEKCILTLKKRSNIPVIIFPGNTLQINKHADGILFLSLISGRNPELLIGNQVIAAPIIRSADLEVLPTGYMLIDGGNSSTTSYISNTTPIPYDKNEIAMCTAIAGEMLGLKLIYMDAGSGAQNCISKSMIKLVSSNIDIPLIIGGGINTPEKAIAACKSGADIIVVGNAVEKDASLIEIMAKAIHTF